MPAFFLHGLAVSGDDLLQAFHRDLIVELDLLGFPLLDEYLLKYVVVHFQDNVAEHLHEPSVAVQGELMSLVCVQALHAVLIETQVQNRVHHARHAYDRAGTNGRPREIGLAAELLARGLLKALYVLFDLFQQARRQPSALLVVFNAGLGGDGESGRHRKTYTGHLCQPGALPPRIERIFSPPSSNRW